MYKYLCKYPEYLYKYYLYKYVKPLYINSICINANKVKLSIEIYVNTTVA